ncbi:MAG: phosphoenolpyruvate carboxykinase (ATP), partial [Candidatus Diapherotrites archaeon]|nr:phosphoenolpyruvate carboxykinase (ATP) [Candidatus Diapherotrites archaeon]
DTSLTSNGRGIIPRHTVKGISASVDLKKLNKIIFLTRRDTVVPVVAKLSPLQAAAFFMLGESIETSAGDPAQAGKPRRCVGTNPFIIGPEGAEGNRMQDIIKKNKIEFYLMNTGSTGKKPGSAGIKISVNDSTNTVLAIARGTILWKKDPDWGYEVATTIPCVEVEKLDPRRHYSAEEYQALTEQLRTERIQWLAQFRELRKEIRRAVEK